ncbi:hypothetical protein [Thermomonas carbonis]|uniref:hypothetical protein n=1 Tax=Thermomonas carbonis TaxID=1463158 RepID=UPI001674A573|nr:hypothetical protein [Thermomonas carbonis]
MDNHERLTAAFVRVKSFHVRRLILLGKAKDEVVTSERIRHRSDVLWVQREEV